MTDEDSEWEDFSEDEEISEYHSLYSENDAERITLRFNYGIVQWDQ